MELLKLENGQVILDPEGESLPCVRGIKRWDRSEKLLNFQNILNGIYFIYKPDGLYDNLTLKEREQIIFDKGHITKEWSNYRTNRHVKELIDVYKKTVLTPARKFLEKIKEDMDEYLGYLSKIPLEKKQYVDQDIEVDVDGEKKTIRVQKVFRTANIDEKNKAYEAALKINTMYEKQKQIVLKEVLDEKAKKAKRRMFDKKGRQTPHNV